MESQPVREANIKQSKDDMEQRKQSYEDFIWIELCLNPLGFQSHEQIVGCLGFFCLKHFDLSLCYFH